MGLRLLDLKRQGCLECSEGMEQGDQGCLGYSEGQGDQGINLSSKKGRFESPDKKGFTISESGFGPEIGCCRVVEI